LSRETISKNILEKGIFILRAVFTAWGILCAEILKIALLRRKILFFEIGILVALKNKKTSFSAKFFNVSNFLVFSHKSA
jgi:hypothetical protein